MTSYQAEDIAEVDPAFGVRLHHSHFLKCIGAPESARLLGHSQVEWVQTMARLDIIAAAVDAGLMASNLEVLGQYVTSLNRMSSEFMRLVLGPKLFPSEAVDVVAPAPQVHRVATRGPGAPGAPRGHPDESYGLMAPTDWPGRSWADV